MSRKADLPPCYPGKGLAVVRTDETPTLIASGYDWECPECGTWNRVPSIPKDGKLVGCRKCGAYFAPFSEPAHHYE